MRVLITGSSDGIGAQTAIELAKKGYNITLHGKDKQKLEKVKNEIQGISNLKIDYNVSDFSCLKNINNTVDYMKGNPPDILINNAGIYNKNYNLSCDNVEMTFYVNYLAHFYLTLLLIKHDLIPKIIINVSSMIHADYIDFNSLTKPSTYDPNEAYSISKLCNLLFTYYLAKRLDKYNVLVNALHPGVINTKMLINNWGSIGASIETGALNVVRTLENIQNNSYTAGYFINAQLSKSKSISYNENIQEKLWRLSFKLCNLDEIKFD